MNAKNFFNNPTVKKIFNNPTVGFFAGIFLTVALDVVLGFSANSYFAFFVVCVMGFIFYTAFTFGIIRSEIDVRLKQLGVTSLWLYEPTEPNEFYRRGMELT